MQHKELIIKFFTYFGLTEDQIVIEELEDTLKITLALESNDTGRFIGRFAGTLDSLQLILSLMLNKGREVHTHVLLDVGGYREERLETLRSMADRIASAVAETGVPHAFPPLSATDRRQVHLLFQDHETLTTYSEGSGQDRRLILANKV